jgi:hypothetical protein
MRSTQATVNSDYEDSGEDSPDSVYGLPEDDTVKGELKESHQSFFTLPVSTEIADPEQSNVATRLPVGSMVSMRDVKWYRDGASLKQQEGGVAILPIGQPTLATLFGKIDTYGDLDPHYCYVSAVGDPSSGRGFDECHLLGREACSFGGMDEQRGSMTCMDKRTVVDTDAKVIHGPNTDAVDYVEYGSGDRIFLSEYRLSK